MRKLMISLGEVFSFFPVKVVERGVKWISQSTAFILSKPVHRPLFP
uniref:Uncharacterized protein n=1 Tax=Rhizophora mucronata TaxID=61149 RepID=A0A2P2PD93_RHIMU